MAEAPFGWMLYNPNISDGTNESIVGTSPYCIRPIDIQLCYKRLFDIYCGAFVEKSGEFLTTLRLFGGDYRRTVMAIETEHLNNETEKMDAVFKVKL